MNDTFRHFDKELDVVHLYSRYGGPLSEMCTKEPSRSKAAKWVDRLTSDHFSTFQQNRLVSIAYQNSENWDEEVVHFRTWTDSKIGLPVSCLKEEKIRIALYQILFFSAMEHRFHSALDHQFYLPIGFELLREGYVLVGWKSRIKEDWNPSSVEEYNLSNVVIY